MFLQTEITDLVNCSVPHIELRLMFKAHDILGNHFNFKDDTRKEMRRGIIYRFNCLICKRFFIKKSIRHLCKRREEHVGDISSDVYKHPMTGYRIYWENIEILNCQNRVKDHELNVKKSSIMFSLIIKIKETKVSPSCLYLVT